MSEALAELEALREATRVRLSKSTVALLREHADMYAAIGEREDGQLANGISVLLDMHDKLEAIRHGQA